MPAPSAPREKKGRHAHSSNAIPAASDALLALHRTRFAEWRPSPIAHLATSRDGSLGVAVREDGDVEFYDLAVPQCSHRIPGDSASSLTCSAVVEEGEGGAPARVFVSGFSGVIAELSAASPRPLATEDSHGGAVWALQPCPTPAPDGGSTLAAACEDGAVRLFSVQPGQPGLTYSRTFPAEAGRVVALAWHPSGASLAAAGVDGTVRVREAATGRELLRVSLRTAGAAADLVVWALLFLPDGTLVAGDSSGAVSMWDARHGTLVARFTQHTADVLALAASPDGAQVWAAGVDASLAMFARTPADGRWTFVSAKRSHTHDVRALAVATGPALPDGPLLLSAGNDAVLLAHSLPGFLKQHPIPVAAAPQCPLSATAATGGEGGALVAVASRGRLDLWRLPLAGARTRGPDAAPPPPPRHLARMSVPAGRHVLAATLSSDGGLLAFCDAARLTVLRLASGREDGSLAPQPLPLPADAPTDVAALAFVPGTATLAAATLDGALCLLDLGPSPPTARDVHGVHDLRFKPWAGRERARSAARALEASIQNLVASPDGRHVALTYRRRLQLVDVARAELVTPAPAPAGDGSNAGPLAGLAFSCDSGSLASLTRAGALSVHSVPGGELAASAATHAPVLLAALKHLGGTLAGLVPHPTQPSTFLIHTSTGVCVVDPFRDPAPEHKRRKREQAHAGLSMPGSNCRLLRSSDVLLHLDVLSNTELLAVEQSWSEARRDIPAPLHRHRYGS